MSTVLATQVRKHTKGPTKAAGRYWKGRAPKGVEAVSESEEEEQQLEQGDVPVGGEHDVVDKDESEEDEDLPTKTLPVKGSRIQVTLKDISISREGKVIAAGRDESGRTTKGERM